MPKRDDKGRFVAGNGGGPGRPRRQTERDYLDVMIGEVTAERWTMIVQRAVYDAAKGDAWARKWLGDYLLPRPALAVELRATDQALLGKLLAALKARDVAPAAVFNAMLAQLAAAGMEGEDDEGE